MFISFLKIHLYLKNQFINLLIAAEIEIRDKSEKAVKTEKALKRPPPTSEQGGLLGFGGLFFHFFLKNSSPGLFFGFVSSFFLCFFQRFQARWPGQYA